MENPFVSTNYDSQRESFTGHMYAGGDVYLTLTPFPEEVSKLPFLNTKYEEADLQTILSPCDVFAEKETIEELRDNWQRPILTKSTNFVIIIEISKTTIQNGIVHSICEQIRNIISTKHYIYLAIILFGSSLKFPVINIKNGKFTFTTMPDVEEFAFTSEFIYFNLCRDQKCISGYLDLIEKVQPENNIMSLPKLFDVFKGFLKEIRSQAFVISSEASTIGNYQETERFFIRYSVSCDLYLIETQISKECSIFCRTINSDLRSFKKQQGSVLAFEIFRTMAKDRFIYPSIHFKMPQQFSLKKCIGRGVTLTPTIFKMAKLTTGDTVHILISFNQKKPIGSSIIRFNIRFLDASRRCFYRIIPFDLSQCITIVNPANDFSFSVIKIIEEMENIEKAPAEINQDIQKIINSPINRNYALGEHPNELIKLVKPMFNGFPPVYDWAILNYIPQIPFIVQKPHHFYLIVAHNVEEVSDEKAMEIVNSFDPLGIYLIKYFPNGITEYDLAHYHL